MKSPTITIERVSNGWIVRPFLAGPDWHNCDLRTEFFVYTKMEDLQKELPALLGCELENAEVSDE